MTPSALISTASKGLTGPDRERFFAEVAFALAGCRHPSMKRAEAALRAPPSWSALRKHTEIEEVVDKYVDEIAGRTPGVPKGVIRQTVVARAGGCHCAEFRILDGKK